MSLWGGRLARLSAFTILLLLSASPALAQVPSAQPGTVTMPLAEYDRLVDRAARPPVPPELPPVPAVVASGDMQVKVSGSEVRGTITLQGQVLKDGRVKVPLITGGTLLDVQQSGAPVPVISESLTTSAILTGPAPFSLTATFGADVTTEPGRGTTMLPAVRAGSVHATIEAPGDNADVRVDRGLIVSRSSAGGVTTVGITLEPGVATRLSWSSREQGSRAAPREVRLVTDAKSLITVADGEQRLAALFDVTIVQGAPEQIELQVPDGFDLVAVSGGTVESAGRNAGRITLNVLEPARRRHQFLVTLERTRAGAAPAAAGGAASNELTLPAVLNAQRETGEVAWEGVGTVELTAQEAGPLRRLDVSEVNPALASLARSPLLAAFRYQRRGSDRVPVSFSVRRFADAAVLGAVAQLATVTTLVSSEGRALTEFSLVVRNRGQLFLKLGLPQGATLLSAEVEGESVKPVDAADGARVPLVRPGFRPTSAYSVSFVYVEAGTAFDKKGEGVLKLPRIDMPISVMRWEVFLPDRYKVRRFEGDAIAGNLLSVAAGSLMPMAAPVEAPIGRGRPAPGFGPLQDDQVGGVVADAQGNALPGVTVTISAGSYRREIITDSRGAFRVSAVPVGEVQVTASLIGFRTASAFLPAPGESVALTLEVGALAEAVTVTGAARTDRRKAPSSPPPQAQMAQAPSQNVANLQQRLSGVLPVRIDIPRAGQSFRFVRPLVLDEETTMRFQYKAQ